jgi:NhaA family Na+:H+ antiporter
MLQHTDLPSRKHSVTRVRLPLEGPLVFLLNNSLLLIVGAAAALLWVNLDPTGYLGLVHGETAFAAEVAPEEALLMHDFSPHFVVNEVLMCFFFAIAAKEIWSAVLPGGALSSPKKVATPLFATVGGVLGPAALFWAGTELVARPDLLRGWAIPCATDIAFSYLVARTIFGRHHVAIPFLLLLAIADDAIGVVILAIFYPAGPLNWAFVIGSLGTGITLNLLLRRLGVRNFWAYLGVSGPIAWYGFFEGGIHPALSLVPLIPTLPHAAGDRSTQTDALREFGRWWRNPVEFILMAFGFVNAGVLLGNIGTPTGLVAFGLMVGKPLGITLATLLAVKVFSFEMPRGMRLRDVIVLGMAGGIGFTVALFVSDVAFASPAHVATLDAAKMGGLLSFASAGVAMFFARLLGVKQRHARSSDLPLPIPVPTPVAMPIPIRRSLDRR